METTETVVERRTVQFGVSAHNLLKYGITFCPECGSEVVGDWFKVWRNCDCKIDTLITSDGEEIPIGQVKVVKLNKKAQQMILSKIDWSGHDVVALYDEFGSFKTVAEYIGVSERSVRRRYDEVTQAEESPLNTFY